jgi:hypothetical protein
MCLVNDKLLFASILLLLCAEGIDSVIIERAHIVTKGPWHATVEGGLVWSLVRQLKKI